jgi:hypothetical protein
VCQIDALAQGGERLDAVTLAPEHGPEVDQGTCVLQHRRGALEHPDRLAQRCDPARTRRAEGLREPGFVASEAEHLPDLALPRKLQRVKRAPRPEAGPEGAGRERLGRGAHVGLARREVPEAIRRRPRFCLSTRYGSSGGAASGVPVSSGRPRSSSTSIRNANA